MTLPLPRCPWCGSDALYTAYHDQEWGVAEHDDQKLFEMLLLESAQAGLAWITVLRKREGYRAAFCGFDPAAVAAMTDEDVERLMHNPAIIRNRLKLKSAIRNARVFVQLQREHGSFANWLWQQVGTHPIINRPTSMADIPARSDLSDRLSKALQQAGMNFVGSTIIYAYLQAVGVVNDHLLSCHRHPDFTPPTA
ncbi:DNA-3-methyladenine glycosylase I [Paludibacterium denitrificans]|uniref:DNA-3-methyladenine glycosylase I n=1 Tax=Paludibacterium denitrificans TaxID=2675226 RepID=A0A844GFT6_9NEIS|nr:DNA-3-methyladenine glycosylase I [Paludibacterium denitrificans]MTD33767.1 DNA-3-methyladenine glycosylase I [Paludibacterium denitrificans]